MENMTHEGLRIALSGRHEAALSYLEKNEKYQTHCAEQKELETQAETILQKLDKDERVIIRRFMEKETNRHSMELDAAYTQGVQDKQSVLAYLGAFYDEEIGGDDILHKFFNGWLYPSEQLGCRHPAYLETNREITKEKKYLESVMQAEDWKHFEHLENLYGTAGSFQDEVIFTYAYQLGARLTAAAFLDN